MAGMAVVLPKETTKALTDLTGESRADVALTLVIRDYARHKLVEIESALQRYEEKYKMPFETYRKIWEGDDREEHYAYEAEQDYLEWEALVTRQERLTDAFAWMP